MKILKIINIKIRNKLIFGFISISLFVAVVSYIGLSTISQIENDYKLISTKSIPIIQHLEDMKFACVRLISSASEFAYIQTESKNRLEASPLEQENNLMDQSCNSCHTAFNQYKQLVKESFPELDQHTNGIRNAGNMVHIAALEFIEMKKQRMSGTEPLEKKEEMEIDETIFLELIEHVIDLTNKKLEEEKTQLESTISSSLRDILMVSGLTFLLSVLIGILYSRSILKPITKLTLLTDDFRKGNLDATIEIKSGDEIGVLGKSFNEMARKIQLLISQLKDEVKLSKQMGESLEKSNHQIKLILEVAGEGIFGLDVEGNIISANPMSSKMLGYEIEELLGKHSHTLIHHSYQDGTPFPNEKCSIYETLNDGKSHYGEAYYWKKDGTCFPVVFSSLPIIENHMITGAVVTFSDITERKRTEMENQVMYQITHGVSTTNSLDELLKLIHQSISKVVYAENCFVALYDQNTGLFSFPFFIDKFDPTPEPTGMDKSCSAYVFRTGKSIIITSEVFRQLEEQNQVELVGSSSPSWLGVPLQTPSRTIGVLVLQHYEEENVYSKGDIRFLDAIGSQIAVAIERKLAEDELRESEEMFRRLFDESNDPILLLDESGFTNCNPSTVSILKYSSEAEILNKKPWELSPERQPDGLLSSEKTKIMIAKAITEGYNQFEWIYTKSDGSDLPVEVMLTPIQLKGKQFLYTIWRDITERKQAEEDLRNGQLLLRTVIDNIPDSIYCKDIACRKTLANLAELYYSGAKSEKEILGKTDFDFYPKELAEGFFADDQLVIRTGQPVLNREEYVFDENRQKQWLLTSKLPMKDGKGNIIGIVGIGRNITTRKLAEEALRESEIKLKVILESTADGILAVDSKGKIIKTNKRFAELWRIPQFLIDSNDDNGLLNFVLEQLFDPEEFVSKVKRLYNSDKEDLDELHFKDGRIFERFSKPLFMHDSSIGRVWSFRDITDRISAVERLRESEDQFRNLVENISDVFFIANEEGKLVYCSPNFFTQTNFLSQQVYGKSYLRFVAPIDRKRVFEFYAEQLKNNVVDAKIDFRAIVASGAFMWVEQNARIIRDNDGRVKQFRIVVRDITDRKRWEEEINKRNEQLSKLNVEKDKFFSIIAHDLKSPLQGLLGLSEILAIGNEDFSKAELTEYGKSLHGSVSNLFKLIENLLEWAQMQRGSIRFTPQELDLSSVVLHNIETIKFRSIQKGITIINDIPSYEKVFADEKMIDTILRNLLSNAVKFTRRDGKVIIRTKKIDDVMLEISVSDTGIGMSEEKIRKLFKIDGMVSSKGTEGEPSTGLGLLLCKEFVEQHGGRIWVESEDEKGSKFAFSLPWKKN